MDKNTLYEGICIKDIVDVVKEVHLSQSKIYNYGYLNECQFNCNEAASLEMIKKFELSLGYKLPEDYEEFLQIANGIRLNTGNIFSTERCVQTRNIFTDYPTNVLVVADCWEGDIQVAIDLKAPREKCMYAIDPIGEEYFYSLDCSFAEFLNRFIQCYGYDYWNWGKVANKKIPKFSK